MKLSVVIPCFNRYDLTDQCLTALELADDVYEIIVVDNGSTDATANLDVAVRNAKNLGFAKACNQGAQASTGDVVCFLNNDTIVHNGWTLHSHLCTDPTVGAAGVKLVYDNGDIQHAGVGVDLTQPPGQEAWNILDHWTTKPADVQAVTGACLSIRRDLFLDLGGFDEGFWNGYEDVDLCLRLLGAGYRNIYDPRSVVTHLESQSGPERWAKVSDNVFRLRAKWSAAA